MKAADWDDATYRSRIRDAKRRERYPAGSPDEEDIAAYARALPPPAAGRALVLGMTPELRALALRHVDHVIAADASAAAIALYQNWASPGSGQRSEVIQADWFDLARLGRFDIILGDGIFGNLPDAAAHVRLLGMIAGLLKPAGVFATRMAMLPAPDMLAGCDSHVLIRRFRAGEIDAAEFGLTLRLFGFHASCFDAVHGWLDNRCVFEHCDAACKSGQMTAGERDIVRRYYYGGRNCLLSRSQWETLLNDAGFTFRITTRPDKLWRHYYMVYQCQRSGLPARS